MWDPALFQERANAMPQPTTLVGYITLHNNVLLDLELTEGNELVIHAGTSLTPSERPEILRFSFADFQTFVEHVIPMFVQRATALYHPLTGLTRLHSLATARQMHREGATHECNEWCIRIGGTRAACAVCGNALNPRIDDDAE